ncbi:MAG TPA: carboxypeptidase-like regulatory domain-containing protein [Blastocatellia bacterium]|nr:carboxypeptidase-like regulatory domain-containing protein [Blastocatellia bacterium]
MSQKRLLIFVPPLAIVLALAALSFGKAARGFQTSALQKKRVAARGHLTGTKEILQITTWQTPDSRGARAHLAIETTGPSARMLWEADGGDLYSQVSSVQAVDLDSDGVMEITSLWRVRPGAAASLRVFHWDKEKSSFTELSAGEDLTGIHSYRVMGVTRARSSLKLVTYVRPNVWGGEYIVRGSEIVPASKGESGGRMGETSRAESGIEGRAVITPTSPVLRTNMPRPDPAPFETGLVVVTAAEGREVARLKTGSDGRFRVTLPPGNYIVKPLMENRRWPRGGEQEVTVTAGKFAQITVTFDSGMR